MKKLSKMLKEKIFNKKNNVYFISFFLSTFIIILIYALNHIYPFGDKTILTMDMSGQYVNYLMYFKHIITGHGNIFYNFTMNLGSNAYGLFAYYISSPLNFLLPFFNQQNITEGILMLNIIKIGLCALTMSILINKTTKNNKYNIIIFSIMYALMSYNLVYSQNIMWLDSCIWLPIVILGLNNILNNKSYFLYIFSLVICIISNFYTGYMVGLFTVMWMIANLIIKYKNKDKNFKQIILKYIKATIITLLISSIILIPVLINLVNSKMDIKGNSFQFELYYNQLTSISRYFIGAFSKEQLGFGAPNIYCGMITLALAISYFVNKKIPNIEKIVYGSLILIIYIAFSLIPLNLLFHMLQEPVFFTFRYSFIFSFILIFLASKSTESFKKIKVQDYIKIVVAICIMISLINCFQLSSINNKKELITLIFLIINSFIFYFSQNKNTLIKILCAIMISIELLTNGYLIIKNMEYVKKSDFINLVKDEEKRVNKYKSNDKEFYRIESRIRRSINDSYLFNYNGMMHYSSLYGKKNKEILTNYGLRQSLIPENCTDTTPVMMSILGIKYQFNKNKNNFYFANDNDDYKNIEKYVYEYKYALPLGYEVSDKLKDLVLTNNPMDNINETLKTMTNTKKNVFEKYDIDNIYDFEKDDDELFILIDGLKQNCLKIYFDNKLVKDTFEINDGANTVVYIPSKVRKVTISKGEKKQKINLNLYKYDNEVFKECYNKLNKNVLKIKKNNERYINASINNKKNILMFTSIVYEKGWKVKINGKKVNAIELPNGFIGIEVPKGNNKIEFKYTPPGFTLGMCASVLGIILLVYGIFDKRKKIKK